MNCLNAKTCAGPDKISTIFFTKCKFVLAIPYYFRVSEPEVAKTSKIQLC